MPVTKQNYISTATMTPEEREIFRPLIDGESHNNGHAFWYEVIGEWKNPFDEPAYKELDAWLVGQGLRKGDVIIVHSQW